MEKRQKFDEYIYIYLILKCKLCPLGFLATNN